MFAALKKTLPRRRSHALLASLCLAAAQAFAGAPATSLTERLAEIREVNRFIPERALPMLQHIESEARTGASADKAEFLSQLCGAYLGLGKHEQALASCDELIEF